MSQQTEDNQQDRVYQQNVQSIQEQLPETFNTKSLMRGYDRIRAIDKFIKRNYNKCYLSQPKDIVGMIKDELHFEVEIQLVKKRRDVVIQK